MEEQLRHLQKEIESALAEAKSLDGLRKIELEYFSRKGPLNAIIKGIKDLPEEQKKEFGPFANQVKVDLVSLLGQLKRKLSPQADSAIDPTLPGERLPQGHLNPLTLMERELVDIFKSLGFSVFDGPELDSDYYNFASLNIPADHPARDMQDTFYVDKPDQDGKLQLLMRTQTSNLQVRAMRKLGAPLRVVMPGRVFRNEATDARHEHTFYQFEGLMIAKDINFGHLKKVFEIVGQRLYGPETKIRMRPKFYPFVEPGSNGEYTCFLCNGQGCRVCKDTGWLEIVGCGLIHPRVLEAGGIDPKKYSGFAFGFGLSRLAMLKYNIDDVRLLTGNDLRFLEQF